MRRNDALARNGGNRWIPQDLEKLIRANLMVKSPFVAQLPVIKASGNVHTVVRRTANTAAWVEGEVTPASYSQSTYDRRNVTVKIIRAAGQVSDFLQSSAMSFVDSLEKEIESATDGMREAFEFMSVWGTADDVDFTGDAYQYSGIVPWILHDAPTTNVFDLDATITLSDLDAAIDATYAKYQGLDGKWAFVMSPQMISKVSGLQTMIQRNVRTLEFPGGFVMATYRDIPLIPSGFIAPNATGASVAGLGATAAGSGSVTAATYRYKVAAITLYGEQVASAAAAVVHGGSSASTSLSWTANANAKLYAIFRTGGDESDDDDNYDLLDIIAAKSYNSSGTVTANVSTYSDTFTLTAKSLVHPLATNSSKAEENILLALLNQDRGVALAVLPPSLGETYGGDPVKNLIRYVPLTESTDTYQFRLKSFHTLQIPDATTCALIRRAQR